MDMYALFFNTALLNENFFTNLITLVSSYYDIIYDIIDCINYLL